MKKLDTFWIKFKIKEGGIKKLVNIYDFKITNETILFIDRYQNRAWVRIDKGSFITSEGNVYDFDFGSSSL